VSKRQDPPTHPPHDEIGCLEAIEMFYAYLDGELEDPREIENFEKHMEHCRSCFSRTEMERLLSDRMKELTKHRAPARLRSRLSKLMDEL
jgi:anti-sigma factor (TIGR02949 family)